MKFAVIVFPGSNCDYDLLWAIQEGLHEEAAFVWHTETSLAGFDAVLIPGGFSYGDYLRCGAIAQFSPIVSEIKRFAAEGKLVFGTCNGFQILTELGLLPGVLKRNDSLQFICKRQDLTIAAPATAFTKAYGDQKQITLPIAHGEGSYYCDEATLADLQANQQIVFTYANGNPNGSLADIAGITNKQGNVLGMMPHPERAIEALLGSEDGLGLFQSMKETILGGVPQ